MTVVGDADRVSVTQTTSDRSRLITGVQCLPRILVAQHALDAHHGRSTESFVSGYQGSPLGGTESAMFRDPDRQAACITFVPGLNEDLGATAVWGTQLSLQGRKKRCDGVVGMWFGKAPGLDRSGDVLRHANLMGADPAGGALLAVGDDPAAKSSTIPSASERTLAGLSIPVLYPGSGQEIVDMGLYAVALSRATGFWVALKIVTDVADGLWSVSDPDPAESQLLTPSFEWEGRPWSYVQGRRASVPESLAAEEQFVGPRASALSQFVQAHPIDSLEVDPPSAWLGIAAAGKTFRDTVQALSDLGLDKDGLEHYGIRLLRIGMVNPLQPDGLLALAAGTETVMVVEEKGPFLETQVRDLLYRSDHRPNVIGQRDAAGQLLVPTASDLTAPRVADALARVLKGRVPISEPHHSGRKRLPVLAEERSSYFCSGCPHNRSTVVPEGSLVGAGIGCHGMAARMPHLAGQIVGITHMGGEGAQWIGQARYNDVPHIFQNMGDGTYFHSGQLAIQACVAAGVNITYKLLFNSAVAMTGGQQVFGARSVPELTHKLSAEGVARTIIVTDEPRRYRRGSGLAPGTTVWDRSRLDEAQRILRDIPGVTVLIYDQQCAAEARRLRKRGQQPERTTRVVINERICEGCGDCGTKSHCLSVEPVETEFGRKTRINQDSCNTDYSCLDGDCPSFVTVEATGSVTEETRRDDPPAVDEPQIPAINGVFNVMMVGIGGTGIVTVNRILATAAEYDGLHAVGLDQTGLSQKAGPVTSHLRITAEADIESNRVSAVDTYLAFDILVAAGNSHLAYADPERTRAYVSTSVVPTGPMVSDPSRHFPDLRELETRIEESVAEVRWIDMIDATERLCGSAIAANLMLLGAAYQAGYLPVSDVAISRAIETNGVAVKANQMAFAWGRVAAADPVAFAAAVEGCREPSTGDSAALGEELLSRSVLSGEVRRLTALRATELARFQKRGLAERYVDLVEAAAEAERRFTEDTAFSAAVAVGLFHLTAIKDEYEVARLMVDPEFLADMRAQFPKGGHFKYRLHPPILRAVGRKSKLSIDSRWTPAFKALAAAKVLRGTAFDPFGRTRIRKSERALRDQYWAMIRTLTQQLEPDNYQRSVSAASAATLVRGYEGVKEGNIVRYSHRLAELGIDTNLGSGSSDAKGA